MESENRNSKRIYLDFRLLDVLMELHALEDYLKLTEQYIDQLHETEKHTFDAKVKELKSSIEDEREWSEANWTYNYRVDYLFPHILRGPFLVMLYSVYEAAVTEIANSLKKKQKLMEENHC